jgi:hypothetical protein
MAADDEVEMGLQAVTLQFADNAQMIERDDVGVGSAAACD